MLPADNLYQRILIESMQIRQERQAARIARQALTAIDRESMRKFDAGIEAEDTQRLRMLRDRYGVGKISKHPKG